jgi:hypothetical protein
MKSLYKKWWFYLLLVIFFFIPIYATKGYDYSNINAVILDLLKASSETYKVAAPFFHIATLIIVVLLIIFKNKVRQVFNIYVCIIFFFFAFSQGVFFTDKYGVAIMGSYVIIFSIIGIYWIWEIIVKQNDFSLPKIPFWKYWVVPFVILSFWSPVELEFRPIYLLTSDYGIAFCFTAPVILAILSLYHPRVNIAVLRVTSFVSLFVGILNMVYIFLDGILWLVILHIPLFVISLYCLILSYLKIKPQPKNLSQV